MQDTVETAKLQDQQCNRGNSCCFTGHRPEKLPWKFDEMDVRCLALKRRMMAAVETAYAEGYRRFLCGMADGCDFYFCECVLALRERHPDVILEAAIPCPRQEENWPEDQRVRYRHLVDCCDKRSVLTQTKNENCMLLRDRYMVDCSSLLIAAYGGTPGGTQYTIQYAISQGVPVEDLKILRPEDERETEKTQKKKRKKNTDCII